ncbi:DHA2 family efflux MFS transporter permease subunit [Gemmatimonas phototrophica]|uniref:DHA2 family efflux MFS transporter permease subunit n=1 Tax=Gemmatimonas phototrophica TaxID=1379270 RepID=UPI000AA655DE|nr:DHA2 family efflux MFS transporter permease subunit [Gemmatimonas phototrophica]
MSTDVMRTLHVEQLKAAAEADAHERTGALPDDQYKHKYLIAIAVTLAAVLELVDTSIVNVAIPHMMGTLGATLDEIAWVSTSYIIANVIVIPMSSWLSAYFGRQRYLTGSIAIFVVASFFCGAATSLWGLVFWRVLQGLGGGALLSTAQTTLFEAFPPQERGIGQAIFGVGVMVGPTLGPTLGGFIVDAYAWPWIFYINVPLGIIAGLMVWAYVKDAAHQVRASSVDVLGIVLLTLAVGSLQWMLERGERFDWFESRFVTMLAIVSVVSAVLLVWRELTIDEPIIDFRVLKSRQLAPGVAFAAFLGVALYGSVFVLPVFLQTLHGYTAQQTGMVILPGAIASAVSMGIMGRAASKIDARPLIVVGALLFLASMYTLSQLTLDAGPDDMFWPLILRGVGLGLLFVPLTGASMAGLPMQKLGQGTGMFNLMRQLGGSLGIAVMATMLSHQTKVHKALLAEHVGSYDPATMERLGGLTRGMVARGFDVATAKQQALMVMDRQMGAQASVMAFSRIYLISGVLLVSALPLLLLWRTGRTVPVKVDAH